MKQHAAACSKNEDVLLTTVMEAFKYADSDARCVAKVFNVFVLDFRCFSPPGSGLWLQKQGMRIMKILMGADYRVCNLYRCSELEDSLSQIAVASSSPAK